MTMKEIQAIVRAWDQARQQGKKAALVTVVHLEGSSYRRPGARMLVTEDGQMTGAISGGCLEGDALRKALLVMEQGQSKLVTYDTSDEDDATIGVQLGCAGVIQVLMEPLTAGVAPNPVELLRKSLEKRQSHVLVTLFSLEHKRSQQEGTCLLVAADGLPTGKLEEGPLRTALLLEASGAFRDKRSSFHNYNDDNQTLTAFIEFLPPPVSLVIIGAGNDVIPVVSLATTLGWESRVVDGRPSHARKERFAGACQVLVSRPEKVLDQVPMDEQTVFILMTHNYNYDLAMLSLLAQRELKYIGVLGPRKKLVHLLEDISGAGIRLTEQQLAQIHGPVGLDIGAETPEEIALSIIAEIQAVLAGKAGQSLRQKEGEIHPREGLTIAQKRLS